MKVLLINAPITEFTVQYYPPLGIAYLAAEIRRQGYDVVIADMVGNSDMNLADVIMTCDIVGVYFNTMNFSEAIECLKLAKKYSKITVVGGPHASFNIESCMNFKEIDYLIIGEGERSSSKLINGIALGSDLSNIPSLVYRKNAQLVINRLEELISDLDSIPFPARDLLPMNLYRMKSNDTSIIASRGCPFKCKFCAGTLMGRNRYRRRSVRNVIQEINEVVTKYEFNRLTFFDDIFTLDRSFVIELCHAILECGYRLGLSCETRVDCIDRELLSIMKSAGFDRIFFGVESGSQDILTRYSKGTTLWQIEEAVTICKELQITPVLSIIIGLPEDTEETIVETIKFARKLDVRNIWFQPFVPFPGTEAYTEAANNGLLAEDLALKSFNLRSVVIGTKDLSKKQVQQLYLRAISTIHGGML